MQTTNKKASVNLKIGNSIQKDIHQGAYIKLKVNVDKEIANFKLHSLAAETGVEAGQLNGNPLVIFHCDSGDHAQLLANHLNSIKEGNAVSSDPAARQAEEQVIQMIQPLMGILSLEVKAHGNKAVLYRSAPLLQPEMVDIFASKLKGSPGSSTLDFSLFLNGDLHKFVEEIKNNVVGAELGFLGAGLLLNLELDIQTVLLLSAAPAQETYVTGAPFPGIKFCATMLASFLPNLVLELEFPSIHEVPEAYKALIEKGPAKAIVAEAIQSLGGLENLVVLAFSALSHVSGPVDVHFFVPDLAWVHAEIHVPGFYSTMLTRANSS